MLIRFQDSRLCQSKLCMRNFFFNEPPRPLYQVVRFMPRFRHKTKYKILKTHQKQQIKIRNHFTTIHVTNRVKIFIAALFFSNYLFSFFFLFFIALPRRVSS